MKLTTEQKRKYSKRIAKFVVASSTAATATAMLNEAIPEADNNRQKVKFAIGAASISAMVAAGAGRWISSEVDGVFEAYDSFKDMANEEPETE